MIKEYKGFTLAEVLITLGVIGVVAAMTIPILSSKYHKSIAEAKLKKFYSVMNQAIRMSIEEHDDIVFMDTTGIENPDNADKLLAWYKEYILKYMTGVQASKINFTHSNGKQHSNRFIKVILNDGSGFTSFFYFEPPYDTKGTLYIFYCLNAMDKTCVPEAYDGKNSFLFKYYPDKKLITTGWFGSRLSSVKASCRSTNVTRHGCSEWMRQNGWKIPSDYPWIK